MQSFYVTDDDDLIALTDFKLVPGRSYPLRVRVFGGVAHGQTRREPDTFRLEVPQILPNSGHFRVVDDNAMVYDCAGVHVNIVGGIVVVCGVVCGQWEAEQKGEALKRIRAMGRP